MTAELRPPDDDGELAVDTGGEDGTVRYRRVGRLVTPFGDLTLFWTLGYGGGLFLPFRDATAGEETYGAGRYLTDTSRAPGAAAWSTRAAGWCSTSTTPTTRHAPTTPAGRARWPRPRTTWAEVRAGERAYPDPA